MDSQLTLRLGVVSFTHIIPEEMNVLGELLCSSNPSDIRKLQERYVLLSNDEKNKFHHDCPIIELLKKDIEASKDPLIHKYYNMLIEAFGKDLVDLLIVENEEIIQNKILYILHFAMDQLYKSSILRVEFVRDKEFQREMSSIPNIIYSTLMMNFDIIDQYLLADPNFVIIKRRN